MTTAEEMMIRFGFAPEHKVQVWEANAAIKNAVEAALLKHGEVAPPMTFGEFLRRHRKTLHVGLLEAQLLSKVIGAFADYKVMVLNGVTGLVKGTTDTTRSA